MNPESPDQPKTSAGTLSVCVLASGSKGNAIYVSDGVTSLLVDAGLSDLLGQSDEPCTCGIGCIQPSLDVEPGVLEVAAQFVRRREEARFRGARPGNRKEHGAGWPGKNVVNRERAPWLEDAMHLLV